MEVIYERCGGIDVHKAMIVVCLRNGRRKETREFGTMTHQLREMTAWLKGAGCEIVAMESTASYWKPLYNIFEMEELPAMVVNAQHMKAKALPLSAGIQIGKLRLRTNSCVSSGHGSTISTTG